MKPTKSKLVLIIVFGAAVFSFLAVRFLVSNGFPVPTSPTNLLVTLAAIALILAGLTIPIWLYKQSLTQYTKGPRPKRVDPFYAVRVLLLAKASVLAGAGFVGWHVGTVIAQLSLPVSFTAALVQNSFGLAASLILTVAAAVSEQICRLPEDPKNDQADSMVSN